MLGELDYKKLSLIPNSKTHKFIFESAQLCNPKEIFICSGTPEEISYIRNMAILAGEEKTLDLCLKEIKGLLKNSMDGKTMIVKFLTLGPIN